jgi:hypothetical protein
LICLRHDIILEKDTRANNMFKISTSGLGTNEIIFKKAESNTTLGFVKMDLTINDRNKDYDRVNIKLKSICKTLLGTIASTQMVSEWLG